MTCKHLMRSEADCVFCERDQLRGNLSLAEEGLANYAQENEQLKLERAAAIDRLLPLGLENEELRAVLFASTVQDMIQGCDCEICHPLCERYEALRRDVPQEAKHGG